MTSKQDNLAVDANGIPILTDLVTDEEPPFTVSDGADSSFTDSRSPREAIRNLLAGELFQLQLDQIASDLAQDVRLQLEQTLANVIDDAINQAMEANTSHTHNAVRRHLDAALPELINQVIQDSDLPS